MARLRFDSLLLGALTAMVALTGAIPVLFFLFLVLIFATERIGLDGSSGIGQVLWGFQMQFFCLVLVYSPVIYQGLAAAVVLGLVLAVVGPRCRSNSAKPAPRRY